MEKEEVDMKKTPILMCAILLLLVIAVVAEAAVIKVKAQTANVRQKPDVTSTVLSRVSMGAMFESSKKVGNFYEISVTDNSGNLVTGYISTDVCEEVGAAPAAPTTPAQVQRPPVTAPPPAVTKKAGGLFIGAGLVMSNLTYDSDTQSMLDQIGYKKKMRLGFQVGVGYEISLSPNFSIMPGLYYSTAGAKYDYTGSDSKAYTDTDSFSTLIIPIDVKLSFNGPFVTVGPYLGYMISAKYVPAVGDSIDMFQADSSGNVYMNRFHFGVSLGAGIDLDLGGMVLMVKAGYQLGLSKLNKPVDSTDTSSMKHNAITILAAIKL
jgi:hypothetical protein